MYRVAVSTFSLPPPWLLSPLRAPDNYYAVMIQHSTHTFDGENALLKLSTLPNSCRVVITEEVHQWAPAEHSEPMHELRDLGRVHSSAEN